MLFLNAVRMFISSIPCRQALLCFVDGFTISDQQSCDAQVYPLDRLVYFHFFLGLIQGIGQVIS